MDMYKKIFFLFLFLFQSNAFALIEVDITRGNLNPLPVAVSPLSIDEVSKKEFEKTIEIKVRSTGRLLKSKVNLKNNHAEVEILEKETGISPGQACVFYLKDDVGDKVLGGGWIDKTFNNYLST